MAKIAKVAVYIMEYERGWGSRVDETRLFDDPETAKMFIQEYNKKNTLSEVPDWYMVAEMGETKWIEV